MNKEMKMVVNTIIDEMGRMEERINTKMDQRFDEVDRRFEIIERRLDSMQHEINANKLEKGTIEMMLDKLMNHEERIEALEQKTPKGSWAAAFGK